ncbi:hypothetical protein IT399_02905 [Candidatus Nomurabacteria bacterium]|nr:hypothetical protein [Candidatus Nomurabacteria bacterium]
MQNFYKKYKKINGKNSGSSVLELLFYIAFFAMLTLVTINAMLTMAKSFKETALQAELMQGGSIMERISREVRASYDVGNISVSDLTLNTKDDLGVNKTVRFLLSSDDIQLWENGTLTGNLNTPNIDIVGLSFTQITTSKGKAVKIVLTIKSANDLLNREENFYDTVVLRGAY